MYRKRKQTARTSQSLVEKVESHFRNDGWIIGKRISLLNGYDVIASTPDGDYRVVIHCEEYNRIVTANDVQRMFSEFRKHNATGLILATHDELSPDASDMLRGSYVVVMDMRLTS